MPAAEIDLERERIACVFALGGGELHVTDDRFPDKWDGVIAYWYEGVPDYATDLKTAEFVDCPKCGGSGPACDDCSGCGGGRWEHREVRTAILDCLYGWPDPPEGWERLASFSTSGERGCWWCGDGTGNEDSRIECKLCEGDGLIYLGDGWCEVVFMRIAQTRSVAARCPSP